jgi:ABC-type transport system involved in multi-copper enzyme maturation permease subunit
MADRATTEPMAASDTSKIIAPAAWLSIIMTATTILLLAILHVLSPEFDPSWRMVSEYAFGQYGWVLSLMFLSWGHQLVGTRGRDLVASQD